ncbi:putative atp-dependent rna helicase dhx8 [Diaporthe ampelina]|uniref:RNA helicase n=1 Tax=Diaporthe ampelina TaxID=1214573 RepID=A0A0G2HTD7_9PEZI|nr:putative atp-dependent rna helicase dhx8 [Diaporthe ampelina]
MAESELGSSFIPALHKPSALLPIAKHRQSLLYLVETRQVTIVVGQTGSGKTTQIPQFLEKAGWCAHGKVIAVTQPRRVAATTVAVRVAEEMGSELGKEVGYSIRFDDVSSAATRIKFLTDGLLIREALVDPLLSRYSVIMVDEAHERATLQAEEFLDFFTRGGMHAQDQPQVTGAIISIEGRTYPIDILYLESPAENYVEKAVNTVLEIHSKEPKGDILAFLTGRDEIEFAINAVAERIAQSNPTSQVLLPLPLYAGLSTDQQMYVFEQAPDNARKVIFSTNIAEASVTIDGITYVVDSGFVKERAYNPLSGIETLTAVPISKAAAAQRAGRAGRTRPGKCFRLYKEETYTNLPDANIPEIQRSNLAPFILQLGALGITNFLRFDFLTPPPAELMSRALELLYSLGALDDYCKLTKPLGMRMAELAVEPMMAKTLLSATLFGCVSEVLTIAAMTSVGGSVWVQNDADRPKELESSRRKFAAEEGDHLTLLNAYQAFVSTGRKEGRFCHDNNLNFKAMTRAVSIRAQLKRYLERFGMSTEESLAAKHTPDDDPARKAEQIRRCLTTGYFSQAAKMVPDGTFRTIDGGTVLHAHPSSIMFNRKTDWVIFTEVVETAKKTFIRDICRIEKGWLLEYAPNFYQLKA